MPDKGGLQLLPETRKSIVITVPGENKFIRIGIILIAIVLVLYGALWWYSNKLNTTLVDWNNQIAALEKNRDPNSESAIMILAQQISTTSQILKSHVYWSTGLSKIESALQNNVQFKSFSGKTIEKTFGIESYTDNYTTLAKQLAAFIADDAIEDVALDNVNILADGRLNFTARVDFNSAKFLIKK